jgi:uncharacterized protein YjiK
MIKRRSRPHGLRAFAIVAVVLGCRSDPPVEAQDTAAAISGYTLNPGTAVQWMLPQRLREISGLAMAPGNRIFAHDDEEAVIYEIDAREGRLIKAFALGDRTTRDDFEGIAVVGDRLFLVSSNGRLYESAEGEDGERLLFNTYGTGVGRYCEVEGLALEPDDRVLLLLCKTSRDDALDGYVAIYRWSVDERAMASDSLLRIPTAAFSDHLPGERFRPSGIERHPETGNYFIVAAQQEAIAEITRTGEVLGVVAFPPSVHPQAEGLTFTEDGRLLIADEGASRGARLTLYPQDRPDRDEDDGESGDEGGRQSEEENSAESREEGSGNEAGGNGRGREESPAEEKSSPGAGGPTPG